MKKLLISLLLPISLAHQAYGHHSFAASFTDEKIMREGVVERYVFRNPHVLLYIEATDDSGS